MMDLSEDLKKIKKENIMDQIKKKVKANENIKFVQFERRI